MPLRPGDICARSKPIILKNQNIASSTRTPQTQLSATTIQTITIIAAVALASIAYFTQNYWTEFS